MIGLQRSDGQRRHLLSADGQEAFARAGDRGRRTGSPASILSTPAARTCRTRTRSFRTGPFGRIFYNQATCRRPASLRSRWSWDPARRAAPMCRQCPTKRSSSKSRAPSFLAGPPLVRAATGEVVSAKTLGGRRPHASFGRCRSPARDDAHALALARRAVSALNREKPWPVERIEPGAATLRSGGDRRHRPADLKTPYEIREVVARLVDGSRFDEFKARFGTTLVCGFAPSTEFPSASSPIMACSSRNRPSRAPISWSSAPSAGFRWSFCRTSPASWSAANTRRRNCQARRQAGDRSRHRESAEDHMLVGGSFGRAITGCARRAFSPRFLWTWPNSRIFGHGGEQAAGVLSSVRGEALKRSGKPWSEEEEARFASRCSICSNAAPSALCIGKALGCGRDRSAQEPRRAGAVSVGGFERADRGDAASDCSECDERSRDETRTTSMP